MNGITPKYKIEFLSKDKFILRKFIKRIKTADTNKIILLVPTKKFITTVKFPIINKAIKG